MYVNNEFLPIKQNVLTMFLSASLIIHGFQIRFGLYYSLKLHFMFSTMCVFNLAMNRSVFNENSSLFEVKYGTIFSDLLFCLLLPWFELRFSNAISIDLFLTNNFYDFSDILDISSIFRFISNIFNL